MTEDLEHFGVKGMHWGVRKEQPQSGFRSQASTLTVSSDLHPSTKQGVKDVAKLMDSRYGFHITDIKTLGPGHPEYAPGYKGTVGFVENTPGKAGGVIYIKKMDLRKGLVSGEKAGWFGPGTGNIHGFITHEASHALFHAEQQHKVDMFGRTKIVGGNQKARDVAIRAALKAAKKDGIEAGPAGLNFAAHVSGYAKYARVQEEIEAEMFSQYHWNPNPPRFIKVWGETLHQELGVDSTPFRETVKHG